MTPSIPNPAEDLILIHKVITRGIKVGMNTASEYLQNGLPEAHSLPGYTRYLICLVTVLRAHHQGEDQVVFPALRSKIPSAPFDLLISNHIEMESLLVDSQAAIEDLAGDAPEEGLRGIAENLSKIWAIWKKHIFWEEQNFSSDALDAVMNQESQRKLSLDMGKHRQEHSEPPYWVVPFILFNLSATDRVSMATFFPAKVTEELVPTVWREHWEPMKPFLLD